MTFNELYEIGRKHGISVLSEKMQDVFYVLHLGDREYVDVAGKTGRYTVDFLSAHGHQPVQEVEVDLGTPHRAGSGVHLIDATQGVFYEE